MWPLYSATCGPLKGNIGPCRPRQRVIPSPDKKTIKLVMFGVCLGYLWGFGGYLEVFVGGFWKVFGGVFRMFLGVT